MVSRKGFCAAMLAFAAVSLPVSAQLRPTAAEYSAYTGLHAAAAAGDVAAVGRFAAALGFEMVGENGERLVVDEQIDLQRRT